MIFFQCPLRNTPSTNDSKGAALDLMGTSVCQPFTWFSPQQNNCHLKIKKKKKKFKDYLALSLPYEKDATPLHLLILHNLWNFIQNLIRHLS